MKIAVLNILSSKKNTLLTLTDLTGTLTYQSYSGGMLTSKDREKNSEYVSVSLIGKVLQKLKEYAFEGVIVKIRSRGGIKVSRPNQGLRFIIKHLSASRYKIIMYEKVTPVPHDGTKRMYGRRGRRT